MADTHHAALMDRTYRHQRLIYDATRAWFLLGRDHLIAHLDVPQRWQQCFGTGLRHRAQSGP